MIVLERLTEANIDHQIQFFGEDKSGNLNLTFKEVRSLIRDTLPELTFYECHCLAVWYAGEHTLYYSPTPLREAAKILQRELL